ncbi:MULTISPECIES: M56 family metallopeptidase [unclassified Streptomyces]|uniref:M56 family metallopeptidase n=1 Tax=unclassified Streptomyces TaxID=2593676 RepID=UPI0033C043CF
MTAVPALIGYAAAVGLLAPRLMLRGWAHRSPALAVFAWHALAVSFTTAVALAAFHLAVPAPHRHTGAAGFLHACGPADTPESGVSTPGIADALAIAVPAAVPLVLLGSFALEVAHARWRRSRHLRVLDVVGRHSAALRATVLDHDLPTAYSLPGLRSRVVVSRGALSLLTADQLDAVLEHERGHIAGRHHLALAAAEAFARTFRRLPLARHAREQTAILLEMIADDRALRRQPRAVLAAAMCDMAAAKTPRGAFAMGGADVLIRLRRVLAPRRRPHPALSAAMAVGVTAVPVLPFLVGCPPVLG